MGRWAGTHVSAMPNPQMAFIMTQVRSSPATHTGYSMRTILKVRVCTLYAAVPVAGLVASGTLSNAWTEVVCMVRFLQDK